MKLIRSIRSIQKEPIIKFVQVGKVKEYKEGLEIDVKVSFCSVLKVLTDWLKR